MRLQFRLVDLMIIVIVGVILAGIMIPALQTGTNCTQSGQCRNNLRNIALALNAYQLRHDVFPPGYLTKTGHSFVPFILPDLDLQPLYHAYNFSQPVGAEENRKVIETRMRLLICPDGSIPDPIAAANMPTGWDRGSAGALIFGPSHYAVNRGGGRNGWGEDFVRKHGQDRGLMMGNRGVAAKEISDGTSMTILVGEKRRSHGWAVGGWAASEYDVGLVPNYSGNSEIGEHVYTGSNHAGGVNFAFCDGSVRVIANGIDQDIWYALITKDGGEKIPEDFEP